MCFHISHRAPGPTREVVLMPHPPRLCPSPPLHPLPGTFPGCPGETWARLPSQSARLRPAPEEATPSSSSRSATLRPFPRPRLLHITSHKLQLCTSPLLSGSCRENTYHAVCVGGTWDQNSGDSCPLTEPGPPLTLWANLCASLDPCAPACT